MIVSETTEPGRYQFLVPLWSFNGDLEKPTIEPSILVRGVRDGKDYRCHSFVKDGQWQFLGDCTHELANRTVPGINFNNK